MCGKHLHNDKSWRKLMAIASRVTPDEAKDAQLPSSRDIAGLRSDVL
jgi:hypothetical protein